MSLSRWLLVLLLPAAKNANLAGLVQCRFFKVLFASFFTLDFYRTLNQLLALKFERRDGILAKFLLECL